MDDRLFPPNLLYQVVNANPHYIFVKNPEGRFMFVNKALATFYKRPIHEIVGVLEQDIFPAAEAVASFRQTDLEVFQSMQPLHDVEETFIDPQSGEQRYFETTKVPLFTSKGEVFAVLGIATEVTHRKQSAQALARNLSFGHVVADLSNQFIQMDFATVDVGIEQALARVGRFISATRASLLLLDSSYKILNNQHSWQAEQHSNVTSLEGIAVDSLAWSMQQLEAGQLVAIADVETLPAEAQFEKTWLIGQQVKASLMFPVAYQRTILGLIQLDFDEPRSWLEEDLMLLQIFADTLANALKRREADEDLRLSFAKQQATLEAMPDLLFTLDKEGNYLEHQLDAEHPDIIGLLGKNLDEVPFIGQPLANKLKEQLMLAVQRQTISSFNYQLSYPRSPSYYEARFSAIDDERVLMLVRDTSEQVLASQSLQQSEERYRQLVESAFQGVLVHKHLEPLYVNQALLEMFGYTREEISQELLLNILPDDVLQRFKHDQATTTTAIAQRFELAIPHKDGHMLYLDCQRSIIQWQHQRASQITVVDITQRKHFEQEMVASERRYRDLFSAAERQARNLLILDRVRTAVAKDIDRQAFIESTVEAIAELGYTMVSLALIEEDKLVIQHALGYPDIISSLALSRGVMGRVARSGTASLVRAGNADPDVIWAFEGICTEVCVPLKEQNAVVGVLNIEGTTGQSFDEDDLTLMLALSEQIGLGLERSRYHEESLESEQRFRAIFDETFQYMGLLTPEGIILEANKSILHVTQLGKEEVQGKRLDDLALWRAAPELAKTLQLAIDRAAQGHFVRLELDFPHQDRDINIDLSIKPISNRQGEVILLIPEGRDISVLTEAQQVLAEREHQLRLLTQNMNDVVCLHDSAGHTMYISPSSFHMMGYEPHQLISYNPYDKGLFHPEDSKRMRAEIHNIIKYENYDTPITYRFKHREGHYVWLESYFRPMQSEEYGKGTVISSTRDITARKAANDALLESEAFLRQVIDTSPLAIFVKDAQGRYTLVNKATAQFYQTTAEAMIGKTEADFGLSAELLGYVQELDQKVIASKEPLFTSEHQLALAHSPTLWFQTTRSPLLSSTGEVRGVLVISTDITERKRTQDQLVYNALYDSLTGLPNRSLFLDRLKHALYRQQRDDSSQFAVMFLDLDRFKVINDSLGHSVGDDLLITLGQRLVESLRSADTVARMGGDEFALLLENVSQEEVLFAADRIQDILSHPITLQGHEVYTTASVGITFSQQGTGNESDFLRRADIAMYHAKNSGKARYAIFDQSMHERAVGMQRMEADLRRALEKQEFSLVYQPIIDLSTQTLTGFEALIRWYHPNKGLMSPDLFIPIAEETGMIVDIGAWVLEAACKRLVDWQKTFPHQQLTMSVNVSTKQFMLPDFAVQVAQVLQQTKLEPAKLKLEITESTLMQNASSNAVILENLRNMGISIQIDDFGTGYSSLNYLHSLPLDSIKIDRSFVSGMDHHDKHLEIVKTIVSLGHSLGLDLVAEGIETETQLLQIRALGCQFGQGYLLSKPLTQTEVEKTWLK